MKHSKPNTKHNTNNEFSHFGGGVFGFKNTVNEVFDYNLNNFSENELPVWAETIKREKHWQQDPDSPTIKKVEYSDGFGRILQTRAQAEDVIFGATEQERRTGNSGLPADQDAQNQPAVARKKGVAEADNVVVSGWKVYNNKGKVVEEYEPFFDKGYGYKTSETYTANLAKMTIKYDAGDRPTETEFPDGSKSLIVYGTPDSIVNPPLESNNKNAFNPSPWTRFTYDQNDLGPLTGGSSASTGAFTPKSETVDALGRTIRTTEHNSQPTTSNPNVFEDVVMKYEYDVMGNLTKVIDPLGRQAFLYFYDLKPHGEEEDDGSNVLKTIHIDKGTQTTVYDASYKPIESKDAKDAWTLNAYDKLERPTHLWARDNAQGSMTLRQVFEYGTDIQFNLRGKLVDQYDEAGLQQNTLYDFKGNLLIKKRRTIKKTELLSVFDGPPPNWEIQRYVVDWTGLNTQILSDREFQIRSTYDALNRVTQIRYPRDANNQGKTLIPHYNRAGALEKVDFDGKDYVKHIAYNAKGQRILLAMGNNVMTRYTYDTQTFRLKRMRSETYTVSKQGNTTTYNTGTNKQDYAYQYDLVGNILKILDESPDAGIGGSTSLERTFEYDPLYRLLSATGRENAPSDPKPWEDYYRSEDKTLTTGYTRKYQYDKLGNILKLQHLGNNNYTRHYNYFNNSNRLEEFEYGSTGSVNYDYDSCGNIISQSTTRKSEWDYADRQITFRDQVAGNEPTKYAQYLYDSEGNRVMKLVRKQGGDWHSITYIDGVFDYLENSDEEKQSISFITDDTSRIASVRVGDSMGDSSPPEKYNLEDNLGSSMTLLDANGSWVNWEEYYPFGETSMGSYAKKRYRYTGKERDEESGMYYYGARYYAPWLCRFISIDPLAGDYPHLTPYNYAGNKPITFKDRKGLSGDGDDKAPDTSANNPPTNGSDLDPIDEGVEFGGEVELAYLEAENTPGMSLTDAIEQSATVLNFILNTPEVLRHVPKNISIPLVIYDDQGAVTNKLSLVGLGSLVQSQGDNKKISPADVLGSFNLATAIMGYLAKDKVNEIAKEQSDVHFFSAENGNIEALKLYADDNNQTLNEDSALFVYSSNAGDVAVIEGVMPTLELFSSASEAADRLGFTPDRIHVGRVSDDSLQTTSEGDLQFFPMFSISLK